MPAPWYADAWDPSWPATEPRDGVAAWNSTAEQRADHPSDIAAQPLITEKAAEMVSGIFKNRWRTLMSVDDVISAVVTECEDLGVADNTYFFFTSDHGSVGWQGGGGGGGGGGEGSACVKPPPPPHSRFQLGQFNILMDKRRVYEWDTRVHLLARGPGIRAGSVVPFPTLNIDLAPTFLQLAGVTAADAPHLNTVDGRSVAPLLLEDVARAPEATRRALGGSNAAARAAELAASWRDTVFFEYYYVNTNDKCTTNDKCANPTERVYPYADAWCADLSSVPNTECWVGSESIDKCETECYPTESKQNNFIAIRNLTAGTLYVEYQTGKQTDEMIEFTDVDFKEL